jgi:hypothetical protein
MDRTLLVSDLKKANATIMSIEKLENELTNNEAGIAKREYAKTVYKAKPKRFGAFVISMIAVSLLCIVVSDQFSRRQVGPVLAVAMFILVLIWFIIRSRSKKFCEIWNREINTARQQNKDILVKTNQFMNSEEFLFAKQLIPEEYFDSESVEYFVKVISNQRADGLKEAMNLYEDFLHKKRLEDYQKQQVELAQMTLSEQKKQNVINSELMKKQAAIMEDIQRNTKATRNAARIGAFLMLVKK